MGDSPASQSVGIAREKSSGQLQYRYLQIEMQAPLNALLCLCRCKVP